MTQKLSRLTWQITDNHRSKKWMIRAYHHGLNDFILSKRYRNYQELSLRTVLHSFTLIQISVPVPEVYGRSNSHGFFVTLVPEA
jgi:hypothetical protein